MGGSRNKERGEGGKGRGKTKKALRMDNLKGSFDVKWKGKLLDARVWSFCGVKKGGKKEMRVRSRGRWSNSRQRCGEGEWKRR